MKPRSMGLVAALALAMALMSGSVAHAARLSFRNSLGRTAWTVTWSEMSLSGGFGTVRCALTLEGSLHSASFAKVRGGLVGVVTGARGSSGCGIFQSRVLTGTLPWHVRYNTFAGTLPNITSIALQVVGFEYLIRETGFGIECLFRSTEAQPLNFTWSRTGSGAVTSATLGGTITADCGIAGTFGGTSSSFTPATLTLI